MTFTGRRNGCHKNSRKGLFETTTSNRKRVNDRPGNVVDDWRKIRWAIQLNGIQRPIVGLEDTIDAIAIRICVVAILCI